MRPSNFSSTFTNCHILNSWDRSDISCSLGHHASSWLNWKLPISNHGNYPLTYSVSYRSLVMSFASIGSQTSGEDKLILSILQSPWWYWRGKLQLGVGNPRTPHPLYETLTYLSWSFLWSTFSSTAVSFDFFEQTPWASFAEVSGIGVAVASGSSSLSCWTAGG